MSLSGSSTFKVPCPRTNHTMDTTQMTVQFCLPGTPRYMLYLSTAQYQARQTTRKLNPSTDFLNYATSRSLQELVGQALNSWQGLPLGTAN